MKAIKLSCLAASLAFGLAVGLPLATAGPGSGTERAAATGAAGTTGEGDRTRLRAMLGGAGKLEKQIASLMRDVESGRLSFRSDRLRRRLETLASQKRSLIVRRLGSVLGRSVLSWYEDLAAIEQRLGRASAETRVATRDVVIFDIEMARENTSDLARTLGKLLTGIASKDPAGAKLLKRMRGEAEKLEKKIASLKRDVAAGRVPFYDGRLRSRLSSLRLELHFDIVRRMGRVLGQPLEDWYSNLAVIDLDLQATEVYSRFRLGRKRDVASSLRRAKASVARLARRVEAALERLPSEDGEDHPPNHPPTVSSITATFDWPVTTYRLTASDPDGDPLTFMWSNTNGCGEFSGAGNTAKWSHPHSGQPGTCPEEHAHAAMITVTVTDGHYLCTALYADGSAAGQGPEPGPCRKN